MLDARARYTLRLTVGGVLHLVEVEARVSDHRHGVVIIRCDDALEAWRGAVDAGIDDAQDALYRRNQWPLQVELLSFTGGESTSVQAARMATCVAIVRAANDSKSWPKVICAEDRLQIVWGPDRA